jgi:two-component system OmpR family response regulator
MTKPFAFAELVARLHALVRRGSGGTVEPTRLVAGDLEMNLVQRRVTRAGREIDLQPREFSLLEVLVRNSGRPVTRTMILEKIFDYRFDPQTNVVDVLVHRLRAKVDEGFPARLIGSVRGVGYVLRDR